ncbi:MOSC N-terminal beta barrel domain-containing protein [Halostella sp. PRR32]|uniref:MOSC domain-containing protein n=1 Tax=Halostella sp. PRR32 TaxID=3098147 RepID=UPI002B1D64D9|nr:MOSC N-terminal beta barrel domain-containing protein [Halostella sp. PRR32]
MQLPTVERIRTYPIKSLDGGERERAELVSGGCLAGDREFAIVDNEGEYVNGVRTPDVHGLSVSVDRESETVAIGRRGENERREFDLNDRADLNAWLSDYFGFDVTVVRDETGMPDRPDRGPTVISAATLREVASWFDGVTVDGTRRRFRANVEIGGVPPFWEDRLYGADGTRSFEIGDVRFEGDGPCGRCAVPTRDPDTGERTEGFQERFVEKREETLPEWTPSERFDHYYKLMTNTRVPGPGRGETISVGDSVRMLSD